MSSLGGPTLKNIISRDVITKFIFIFQPLPMLHKELTQGGGRLLATADSALESSLKIASSEMPEESTIITPTEEDPVSNLLTLQARVAQLLACRLADPEI